MLNKTINDNQLNRAKVIAIFNNEMHKLIKFSLMLETCGKVLYFYFRNNLST